MVLKKMLYNKRLKNTPIKKALAKDYIYGDEDISLPEVIGQILLDKKATVGLAESCSGGYVSHLITSVAGSSLYFKGTLVAYAYEIKENVLGVSKETIDTKGAVSEEGVLCKWPKMLANF